MSEPHPDKLPRPVAPLFRLGAVLAGVILLGDLAILVAGLVRLSPCMVAMGVVGGLISWSYAYMLWQWGGQITRGEPLEH